VARDDAFGQAVAAFLAQLGLQGVTARPTQAGAPPFEALEGLRGADFALVLQPERQLELGYLLAVLGRERICVLQQGAGASPLPGLAHLSVDDAGVWRLVLAREMKKAGLEIDLNKAL
jgi:hypothetical protein